MTKNPGKNTGKHRAPGRARLASHPIDFTPAHCAGQSCVHPHAGEPPLPVFAHLTAPVPRCERTGAHGAHDVTTDERDYRCPGRASMSLPTPQLMMRTEQARAAIKAGSR